MSEAVPYRPSDLDALPVPLRVRLDSFRSELRRLARSVGPAHATSVAATADAFDRLLRDIGLSYAELAQEAQAAAAPAGPPLTAVPDLPPDPEPAAPSGQQDAPSGEQDFNFQTFQRPPSRSRSGRRSPAAAGRPTVAPEGEGRLLPDPCTKCGGKVFRAPGAVGRNPKVCPTCRDRQRNPPTGGHLATSAYRRAHPEPGMRRCSRCTNVKPDTDDNFAPKSGTHDSMCRPCRGDYAAARYVRAGYRVVTVEVLPTDPCCGQPCPVCHEAFKPGDRIQGEHVKHERCAE